jgi:hypothetical protein
MDEFTRREAPAAVGAVGGVGLTGCLGGDGAGSDSRIENDPEAGWRDVSLTDVRTDESFS